jgi:ABC-2 type transport system permease protein
VSRLGTQVRTEVRQTARNSEQLLLTLGIPVMLLVFFSLVEVLPTDTDEPIDFLAPGVLALAVMSTAMVSLGIGTGFERTYLVLKRLGATPLGRGRLITAKIAAVIVVELVQFAVLVPVAYALGWRPSSPNWPLALAAVVLGTVAFAGIGLTLAGRLRGEINLAAQNGLYLVLLLLGGMVIPVDELPGPMRAVASALPSGALADAIRDALTGAGSRPGSSWLVLAGWAVVSPLVARRLFRFE